MATLIKKDTSGIYIAQEGEEEVAAWRTRAFKKFRVSGTRQRRVAGQIGPIHYRNDPFSDTEQYKEIDLTINLTPGESWDAAVESNGYQVRFWQSRVIASKNVRYIAQFRRAGKWLAMAPLALIWENDAGERQLISKPVGGIIPEIDNDAYRVTWTDCFGSGIHYRYNIRPDEFFKTVIVDNKSDLPAPTIGLAGLKLTVVLGISWNGKAANGFAGSITPDEIPNDIDEGGIDEELTDSDRFAFQDQDESFRDTFWMERPKAWDSAEERHEINVDWRLRRRGNRVFAALSVPATVLNNPQVVYPVFMDINIPEESVSGNADDVEYWASNDFYAHRTFMVIGYFSGSDNRACMAVRFQTVPIPNGVTIVSATLTFYSTVVRSDSDTFGWVQAEDADDPAVWPGAVADFKTRFANRTTAAIDWGPIIAVQSGDPFSPPDMSPVVKELVDRVGWAPLQAMAFFAHDDDDRSSANRRGAAYEDVSRPPAQLNVSYTEAFPQIIGGVIF